MTAAGSQWDGRTCPWCENHPTPWLCGHGEEAPPPEPPTEGDYFAGDRDLYRGRTRLCWTRDPVKRAAILEREAEVTEHRAALHVAVFGDVQPDDYDDDGTPPALWLAYSARLLRIVANAERHRAAGTSWVSCDDPLEEPVVLMLHWLASGVGSSRRGLLKAMCDVWYPLVGAQAVETVYTLPCGWSWLRGAWCAVDDALRGRS